MTAWFARVGLPFAEDELAAIADLLRVVAPRAPVAITALASWQEAAVFVRAAAHDSAWWDDEEEERELLWARAADVRTEAALLDLVTTMTQGSTPSLRDAARAAVTAAGVADTALAGEATAMALLAAHQNALAEIAGAGSGHRFVRKYALWKGGAIRVYVVGNFSVAAGPNQALERGGGIKIPSGVRARVRSIRKPSSMRAFCQRPKR